MPMELIDGALVTVNKLGEMDGIQPDRILYKLSQMGIIPIYILWW